MSDKAGTKKKICIACGGSAGHIFPGLTLAEELAGRYGAGAEISFITSENRLARSILEKSAFKFRMLPLQGIKNRTAFEHMDFIAGLVSGTFGTLKIFLSDRPDCFVGFGSYASGPPFAIASLLGIPTLIHEQNIAFGKANRIMRAFATRVAVSFPEAPGQAKRAVLTGNPIRKAAAEIHDRIRALDSLGLTHDRFTILVMGGSQGARAINHAAAKTFKNMEQRAWRKIQVIHITGEKDYEAVKKEYQGTSISNRVHSFFWDMGVVYSAADIAISRAGASAVCELAAHKIPSILIPYPFAGKHQIQNAGFFKEKGAAVVIEEEDLSGDILAKEIEHLINEKTLRKSLSERIEKLAVFDAGKKLADEVESLLWKK